MKRVMILGSPGSGKSTLARRLGNVTGLPVVHIDTIFWKPGWVQRPDEEAAAMIREAAAADAWVFDGNNSSTFACRADRADTIVYLDFPRWLCFKRALGRIWKYRGTVRPSMGEACRERFDPTFLYYILFTFPGRSRPKIERLLAETRDRVRQVILRTPDQVEEWLENLHSPQVG